MALLPAPFECRIIAYARHSHVLRCLRRAEGPAREDNTRRRTFRTKEETQKSKNITSTVVVSLLLIACVVSCWGAVPAAASLAACHARVHNPPSSPPQVPMLQYYGYVAKD